MTDRALNRRKLVDDVFARAARGEVTDGVRARVRGDRLPASHAQQRLCFLESLNGPNATYNVPFVVRLEGALDTAALWAAFDDLAGRHESLRTTFAAEHDDVYQVIADKSQISRDLRDTDGEHAALELLKELAQQPFHLHSGEPLVRTTLVRAGAEVYLLLVNLHHSITDGWSEGILFAEIGDFYTARVQGTVPAPAPLSVQYADYSAWEAEPDTVRLYESQLDHWRKHLAELPEEAGIPTDRPRPQLLSGTGASVPVDVPVDLTEQAGRAHGASLFEASMTALAALIHRYNGEDRVVVGVPVANRPWPEWEPVVGYFANSLAVPVEVSGDLTLDMLLARVRTASAEALSHQNVPFDRVVEALGVRRHPGMNPVFQVMCSVNRMARAPHLPGVETTLVEVGTGTAKFDLELAVSFEAGRVAVALDYADDLFDRASVEQMAADYTCVLDALLTVPGTTVGRVALSRHPDVVVDGRPVELRDRYGNRVPTGVFGRWDGRRGRVTHEGLLEFTDRTSPAADRAAGGGAPATPTEAALAGIWSEVLDRPEIERDGDFFSIGGDSLLATKAVARTRRRWGARLTVRHMLAHRTLRALAEVIDAEIADAEATGTTTPAGEDAARKAPTPPTPVPTAPGSAAPSLSMAQRGIWIVNQLEGHGGYYHMPLAVHLAGPLDPDALAEALTDLVGRHESLRTVFPDDGGAPRQVVRPVAETRVDLPVADTTDLDTDLRAAAAEPFDLRTEIPLRAKVLRLGPQEHVLLVVVHHISCDGLSWAPLCRDLARAYEARRLGRAPGWEPLSVQFADFTRWQQAALGAADDPASRLGQSLAYWREQLAGLPEEVALPRDHTRPAVPQHQVWQTTVDLGPGSYQRVADFARQTHTSVFMVVQAALVALLSRMGAGSDIPLGSPTAGRGDQGFDDLVGCFINTVVLRTDAPGDATFRELLDRVRDTTLAAQQHGDLPFDLLVQEFNPERVPGRNPLFQVMCTLNSGPEPSPELAGLECTPLEVPTAPAPFDLSVELTEDSERGVITGYLTADTQLFEERTARSLAERFARVIVNAIREPDLPLSRMDVLSPGEREHLLDTWSGRPGGAARTLPELFAHAVAENPDAPALEAEGTRLTYAELDQRADSLASELVHRGVGAADVVAFALPRGAALITAVLAISKSGAAFLPLAPDHPDSRIAFTLADAGAALLLTAQEPGAELDVPVLVLDETPLPHRPPVRPRRDPSTPAYVMYTSGSTGRPKGVVVPHRQLANLGEHLREVLHADPGSRVLHQTSTTFDVFVGELLLWIAARGTLVIAPPYPLVGVQLADFMERERVTHAMLTPTALGTMPDRPLPDLKGLQVAGEVLPAALARRWTNGRTVVNGYGPTEATVLASTSTLSAEGTPTIGRPVPGMRCYVFDDALAPVPAGVPGELYLAGDGLADGYLGRPVLTAERFLPCPHGSPGERMYRTGDIVRWTADGELEFLGRDDDQVKIRGMRVELGEIEAVLREHSAVEGAAVVVDGAGTPDTRLVAYVCPAAPPDLLARAARTLPRSLVPSVVVALDALPMLPTGKTDRAALPAPPEAGLTADRTEPRTRTERELRKIWQGLFDGRQVGVKDNFFALGGHSLTAIQMLGDIRGSLGVQVPLSRCFTHPTIAELAAYLDGLADSAQDADQTPVVRRRRGSR